MRARTFAVVAIILAVPTCLSMVNYWQQHSSSQGTIDAVTNFDGLIEIGILESRSSAQVLSVYDINPKAGTIKLAREAHIRGKRFRRTAARRCSHLTVLG